MVMLRRRSSSTSTLLFIISFFLLISSTISLHPYRDITPGSSISSAASFSTSTSRSCSCSTSSPSIPFWLSPSGLFAFGFYPLNCNYDEFIIGIWLVNSSQRTLVWSINVDNVHSTFNYDVSLHFTNHGKFVVQKTTFENDEMIIIRKTPIFFPNYYDSSKTEYASLHDNGNLVIYDWDGDIVWESFDHPTDTILPGQTLNPGQSLVSSKNRLTMKENGNLELLKEKQQHEDNVIYWKSYSSSIAALRLNSTGHLDLVDTNGYIVKRLNNNHNGTIQQQNDEEGMISAMLYRATLDSDGEFRLYNERIVRSSFGKLMCEKIENSAIIVWDTKLRSSDQLDTLTPFLNSLSITLVVSIVALVTFNKLGLFMDIYRVRS